MDGQGRVKAAVYQDADGDMVEQEADLFILACGAMESARLLLLSNPAASRTGSPTAATSSGATSPSTSTAPRSGPVDDPIYAWAGGGYVSASTFQFYEHDERRGFVGGGHIAAAGVGIPLPINWRLPGSPTWGAAAKQIDRELLQPQHGRRHGACTTCRSTTTGSSWTTRSVDAWGLPVARITLKPHANDLARAIILIDRNAEILEAAGAKSVQKVYIDRITGNCSHQHGTTRMGDDPATSVLDRWCRAHEVDNLYVVDGGPFPTGTGANPTLTIMANAWRVADKIISERGRAA